MKHYTCGQCSHLKYEDSNGDGYCDLWEESDVNIKDEACVEFELKESDKEIDWE